MKATISFNKGSRMARFPLILSIRNLFISTLFLTGIPATLEAQNSQEIQYTTPSWWLGMAGGANFNFYRGSTQMLSETFTSPATFHDGFGVGLFVAPVLEYHRPNTRLGFIVQAGYDSRRGDFDQIKTPCNCPADLLTNLSYLTIEPNLRYAPFKSNFYLFGGPRFAFYQTKGFTYSQGINPDFPAQTPVADVEGSWSSINKNLISMQIGAGYDILLSAKDNKTQYILSPFVSFQPYFGQNPRSVETWNMTTVRTGIAFKFGNGIRKSTPMNEKSESDILLIADPEVQFSVISPENIPVDRRVRETFPLRNYIFFDLGSTEIPDRYVLISKDQVKDFNEDQLEVFMPKKLSGRSDRQMVVYYNVLNILGDRMAANPSTEVRLSGASMEGKEDGLAMAESVKRYLVNVFDIDPTRLTTEGRIKPRIPSEQPGGTKELVALREGDHRVSIWSTSPELMMEFQSGPDAPLKPVVINAIQEAPIDSYVTFNAIGAEKAYTSWSLEIRDEDNRVQYLGPYTEESVNLPGKLMLDNRSAGNFMVTMIGQTKSGKTVKKEVPVHMVLWTPSEREEGMRFTIIYEFNESKSIKIYDTYLSEIVTPKIPKNSTVIIHGYSDNIGNEANNQILSLARADDVLNILKKALAKANRTDVNFQVYGFGEDEYDAQFSNALPEGRFYNRSVIIDIIPHN